jgi:hypothetical protein
MKYSKADVFTNTRTPNSGTCFHSCFCVLLCMIVCQLNLPETKSRTSPVMRLETIWFSAYAYKYLHKLVGNFYNFIMRCYFIRTYLSPWCYIYMKWASKHPFLSRRSFWIRLLLNSLVSGKCKISNGTLNLSYRNTVWNSKPSSAINKEIS